MWVYNNTHELYHYGVPGMKWGVRRFQNEDGTLTPAGEKRYNDDSDNIETKKPNPRKKYLNIELN